MSQTSGRPTVRINEKPGKPPTIFEKRKDRTANNDIPKFVKPKRQKPVSNKPTKPEWRTFLPLWLRESEPKVKRTLHWIVWYFYSRIVFALPWVKMNHETVRVPNFIDFHNGYQENSDYVRTTRQNSSAVVSVAEAGGGVSKTTISTLLGAQRSLSTDMSVIVYDGDTSNPNVFMWYDLDPAGGWLTSESLLCYLNEGWVPTYNDMTKYCAAEFDSGVFAIHARAGLSINAKSTNLIVNRVRPTCHTLICDTQPGTLGGDEQTSTLVHSADIVIVPGIASGAKELMAITATLDYIPYGLRNNDDKVAPHVIIAISGVKPRGFNLRTRYLFAKRYNANVEQIVLLPYSQYIKGDGNFDKINKIKISALDMRMRYGVSDLDRTVSELAIQLNNERRPIESLRNTVPTEPLFRAPSHHQPEHLESASTPKGVS